MRWKSLLYLPFLLLLSVLLVEGILRIGARVVQARTRSDPAAFLTGNVRVLCVGDSNTYGLGVERDEAYPQQLEALWNAAVDSPKLEVLNLGAPGTNSSRVLRDFRQLSETFLPDVVVLLVGVNDFWTRSFSVGDTHASGLVERVRSHSILYRIYSLWRRGLDARELEVVLDRVDASGETLEERLRAPGTRTYRVRFGDAEFDLGFEWGAGIIGDRESLEEDLRRLVAEAEALDVPLFLVSYPAGRDFYAVANDAIREVARTTRVPLVDLGQVFEARCPQQVCPELLLEDGHPTPAGYRIVAQTLVERITGRLQRRSAGAGGG